MWKGETAANFDLIERVIYERLRMLIKRSHEDILIRFVNQVELQQAARTTPHPRASASAFHRADPPPA